LGGGERAAARVRQKEVAMHSALRVLHLEDNAADTELVQARLEAEGIPSLLTRVENAQDFLAALRKGDVDLVLADYTLPAFDGISALMLAQRHAADVPFIFVSGTLGEEVAVEALKLGATDYILKTRLVRLAPSIKRALRNTEEKKERERAEEAALRSERDLRNLIETMPTMAFATRPDGSSEFITPGWLEYSGLSLEASQGSGWEVTIHPDDLPIHRDKWLNSISSGEPFENEARHRSAQGEYRWFLVRAVPLRDERGKILKWYGAMTDVENQKRAEALLAGENRILEMVAKGDSLSSILDSLCRLVEEQADDVLASILLLDGVRLRHGGGPSLPQAYSDAIDGAVIGPAAGSCGTAAFTGKQVIVEDIATDPLWKDYRQLALSHSLRACWSTPVFSSQRKVIATFAMYYHHPRRPSARDQEIIQQITHLAGIAIERKVTQDKLSLSERSLTEAQQLTQTGSFVWDIKANKALYLSDEWYRIYEFPIGYEDAWEDRLKRLHPADRQKWKAAIERAIKEKSDYELEKLLLVGNGTKKYLHAVGHPILDKSGEVGQFIGTVTDITERKTAEEAVRVSEARYRILVEHAPEAIVVLDFEQKRFVDVNENAVRLFGHSKEALLQMGPVSLSPAVQPDGRASSELAREKLSEAAEGGTPVFEWMHLNAAGQEIPCEIRLVRVPAADRVLIRGSVTDITDRKRTEALLAGEKRLLEMIATGVSLKEIAYTLCEVIEEQRPNTLASVLLSNPDGVHLDLIAGPKLPKEWIEQMQKLPIGPCAGSCGTAAYRGSPVIVSDIANDPLWDVPDHRASALHHGLHASWSNPVLSSSGKVLGTFCMYYREPRSPTLPDLELIELATHLVRIAIERDHAQEALRKSEQLARSHVDVMMRSLDVLATEAAPEKFIGEMLRTIGQNLGAVRVLLWLRDQNDDSLRLDLAMEKDRQVPTDPKHPLIRDPRAWRKMAFLQEMLFTKSPMVCDDIQNEARISPEFRDYLVSWGAKRFMTVPMFVTGELRGFIGIQHAEAGAYRADQIELAQALAHHVMLAVRSQELVDQQREAAILKERTRMARDIHDTLAQGFTGVVVQMEAAEEALIEEDPENVARHVCRARKLARESLAEARRSVHALRPQALEKAGFTDALKAIIENTAAGTPLSTEFQLDGKPRELTPDVEENLLHIGQEALTNALKHARATKFQTRLCFDSDAIRLELSDNGDGFVADRVNGDGFGLIGMKERADQIGATIRISSKPGEGTKIVAVSPYQNSTA
jgi:PAS domain S-box-containing protein